MRNAPSAKPYTLIHELRPGYLYVCVTCDRMSYRIVRGYWDEIVTLCEQTECTRVMLEKRITAELEVTDLFRIGSEVANELSEIKLAVYDPITSTRIREFGEMVSTNRGLNARTFTDFKAAEIWLLGTRDPSWL